MGAVDSGAGEKLHISSDNTSSLLEKQLIDLLAVPILASRRFVTSNIMNDFEKRLQDIARESFIKETFSRQSSALLSNSNISSPVPVPAPPKSNYLTFNTVDVFTTTRFKGNQLAIVHVPAALSLAGQSALLKELKQTIAREFNFSETVFLHEPLPSSSPRRLDIFTLKEELPFAGHPVIGTICHVCQSVEPPLERVTLLCKAGIIEGRYDRKEKMAEAEIPHDIRIHHQPVGGRAVLKTQPYLSRTSIVTSELPVVSIVKGMSFILVSLPSVKPHLEKLDVGYFDVDDSYVTLDEGWEKSFVGTYFYAITSHPNEKITRIRTRMLEPSVGEDPATGSAACTLACFLSLKEGKANKMHKTYEYSIQQGVEMGRESEMFVRVTLEASGKAVQKVVLAGRAVLVTQGTIMLPET